MGHETSEVADLQELAIESLAEKLYMEMERLDPIDGTEWKDVSDDDREFYRQSVKAVILDRDLVMVAWKESACPKPSSGPASDMTG